MLKPTKKRNYKSPHLANFDKKYPSDNDENIKMPDVKHITPISTFFINKYSIST